MVPWSLLEVFLSWDPAARILGDSLTSRHGAATSVLLGMEERWVTRKKMPQSIRYRNKPPRSHYDSRFQKQVFSLTLAYLTMKSNSDPASISTPSSVDTAPSKTGANMCSRASTALRFLSPMAVRKAWVKRQVVRSGHGTRPGT